MKYVYTVTGGVFTNTNFDEIISAEVYGPFDEYREAFDVWQSNSRKNIDNCSHRLYIMKEEYFEQTNAKYVEYIGDSFDMIGKKLKVIEEGPRTYRVVDGKSMVAWVAKNDCEIIEWRDQ